MLTPTIDLTALFDRNRRLYGTATMMADDDDAKAAAAKAAADVAAAKGGDDDLGDKGKAALDRLRSDLKAEKARSADLATKASRLDELEEASKTEQQKANDRAAAAEKRAEDLEQRVLRAEVAAAKGLPAKLATRLQGATKEELEADADDLLTDYKPADQQTRRTTSDAGKGGDGPDMTMSDRLRAAAGRSAV